MGFALRNRNLQTLQNISTTNLVKSGRNQSHKIWIKVSVHISQSLVDFTDIDE